MALRWGRGIRKGKRMERVEPRTTKRSGTVVDARMSLALWLRAGRAQRGMSIEDVAKITKIQARILERLEAGKLDGLPAEVFVRGFVRSFARCVGLDEKEALQRFTAISGALGSTGAPPVARAFVDSMSDLAPRAASRVTGPVMLVQAPPAIEEIAPMIEVPASSNDALPVQADAVVVEAPPVVVAHAPDAVAVVAEAAIETLDADAPKKSKKKSRGGRRKRKSIATGTPAEATPVVAQAEVSIETPPVDVERPVVAEVSPELAAFAGITDAPLAVESASVDVVVEIDEPVIDATPSAEAYWAPKMPAVQASVPWRRSTTSTATTSAPLVPSLVIDDSAPDEAERVLEDRAAAKVSTTNAQRRSFLPPILLDREDRSARQGGLTLAVILLLLAAAVTLSYLMRRPSSTGDGITLIDTDTPATLG